MGSEKPDVGSERPNLGSERLDLGSGRPDLGSERPDWRSERLDLGSERPNLRLGGGGGCTYLRKMETEENCPMWNHRPKNKGKEKQKEER